MKKVSWLLLALLFFVTFPSSGITNNALSNLTTGSVRSFAHIWF